MLTVPMMAKVANRAYISHGLFELELFVGAGFFSGLVGSGILFKPLKAFEELNLRHILGVRQTYV